jgi:hypothetical protein
MRQGLLPGLICNPPVVIGYPLSVSALRRPGGHSGETPPDPISNSAVKLPSVDGTMSQGMGE